MKGIYVSDFNKKANAKLKLPKKVRIYDTTLRDGEQTPGVSFRKDEKLEIAKGLSKLGVDYIEAGFPINSQPEFDVVKEISDMGLKSKVAGLARVVEKDIDACIKAEVDLVHVFVSTSDIHLKYQMGKSRKEVLEMAVSAVKKIKKEGHPCLFSAMDATRTDLDYLVKVCSSVQKEGADIINLPDTVGVMHPPAMRHMISEVRKKIKVPIDTHNHNDFGLGVANTLAAIEAGADGAQVTINGMGERAGNADLEQVVMSLYSLYGLKTNIKTQYLSELSALVERASEIALPPFFPIVGDNAFAHESGIHAHAVLKKAKTFEPIMPEIVGQKRRIVYGKHTGKAAIENALKEMGYKKVDALLLNKITSRIKEVAEAKKRIYDEDIVAIAEDVLGEAKKKEPLVELDEVTVISGNKVTPAASVVLKYKDQVIRGASQGVGPVDAASRAIQEMIPDSKLTLMEYNLRAITGGTDALADVTIKIMDEKKNEYAANAVDEDIVMASVQALLRAVNDALRARERRKKK